MKCCTAARGKLLALDFSVAPPTGVWTMGDYYTLFLFSPMYFQGSVFVVQGGYPDGPGQHWMFSLTAVAPTTGAELFDVQLEPHYVDMCAFTLAAAPNGAVFTHGMWSYMAQGAVRSSRRDIS